MARTAPEGIAATPSDGLAAPLRRLRPVGAAKMRGLGLRPPRCVVVAGDLNVKIVAPTRSRAVRPSRKAR